ncbi:MraY family glycosyltransferase [Mucilaginibacter agri]|uniref:UDP-GlcNAc--UDP-phosphate GlcNAc-1-phosphate transferase n=1 Tax=Mucilaginibacter agri TaxID=2695265 RepID=A0A965ZM85_9SPHI|nr:glycosyltransferase family 4 protein [Mucilaginibacter agri]NCD72286.1 UDP-GlcNAc--UDP-phosphate GlcNAc-1-phosphate transferase [Mucilaginibacter agri]
MSVYIIVIILFFLLVIEIIYFKIAGHYNVIDKPNHRSSHSNLTIRGGGIIFALALLLYPLYNDLIYPWFLLGLLIIAFISFIDDVRPLSSKLRILFHSIAVALLFIQIHLFTLAFYWVVLALIFVIGTINAINFMDGINGITGLYGLVALGTLYYTNTLVRFTTDSFLLTAILSVLVFNFFNFRKKAKCFAGDVGSVSIAFIIVFFMFQLILKTQDVRYILLLLVYGLDTSTTIIFRLIRKENVLEAHRSHFYQYLANEQKIPHLIVAAIYGLVQLLINIALLSFVPHSLPVILLFTILSAVLFVGVRFYIEGTSHLLKNTKAK